MIMGEIMSQIYTLEPPDSHYFSAAEGWLMLGDHLSAQEELVKIAPAFQNHPGVLDMRWQICLKIKQFQQCLATAQELIQVAPKLPNSWVRYAQSYYYLGQYQEAYKCASQGLKEFPKDYALHYDLACYACLLGRLAEAKTYLKKACKWGDAATVKAMAAEDKDLQALWQEIPDL